ncbi:hypothetical protein ACFLZ1_03765 [Patescibacteria group bacterium]
MKKVITKTLIFVGFFIITFFLNKAETFKLQSAYLTTSGIDLVLWLLGAVLGSHFLKIDQLIYVYFTRPEQPLSLEVRALISQKKIGPAWDLLDSRSIEQKQLALRSFLFQISWVVLVLFTLTSTASYFGKALVMGIGLKLLLEEWDDFLHAGNISWLFWQIKREVGIKEQRVYLYIMTTVFIILTFFII